MIALQWGRVFGCFATGEDNAQKSGRDNDLSPFHKPQMTQLALLAKCIDAFRNITGEISGVWAMFSLRGRSLGQE